MNLFVSDFNFLATEAIKRFQVEKWPKVTLIYGPVGVGKTELLRSLYHKIRQVGSIPKGSLAGPLNVGSERVGAVLADSLTFAKEYAFAAQEGMLISFRQSYRSARWLLMDDIHLLKGKKKTIEELLHTFEHMMEQGGRAVFTLQAGTPDVEFLGERLASRVKGGLILPVNSPERLELASYVAYLLNRRLSPMLKETSVGEIITELASHVENLRAAQEVLDKFILFMAKVPSLNKDHFEHFWQGFEEEARTTANPENTIRVVAEVCRIPVEDILGNRRTPRIVEARHLAMYVLRKLCHASYTEVGRQFGKEHGTIIHACRGIEAKFSTDDGLRERLEVIYKVFVK
ncbi:MAG: helix-turn-helix domain-containing protein [Desulfitobacteriaceae bacterium]